MAEFRVTNTHAGRTTVKVRSENTENQIELLFSGDPATAVIKNFYADPQYDGGAADGKSENRMVAEVTDANNNPVSEIAVNFSTKDKNIIIKSKQSKTDNYGMTVVNLSSTLSGGHVISASVNNKTREAKTNFTTPVETLRFDDVKFDKLQAIADGIEHINLKFRVVDAYGRPEKNAQVNISSSKKVVLSSSSVFTRQDGTNEINIWSKTPENDVKIQLSLTNGRMITTDGISFIPNKKNARLLIVDKKDNSEANGIDKNELKIQVVDLDSKIPFKKMKLHVSTSDNIKLDDKELSTDNDGYAVVRFSSHKAGKFALIFFSDTNHTYLDKVETNFIFDHSTVAFRGVTTRQIAVVADGKSKHQLSVYLADKNGNPAKDITIISHSTDEGVQTEAQAVTNVNGIAILNITSKKAGYKTIKLTTQNITTVPANKDILFLTDVHNLRLSNTQISAKSITVGRDAYFTGKIEDKNGNPASFLSFNVELISNNKTKSFSGVTDTGGDFRIKISTQKSGDYYLQTKIGDKTEIVYKKLTFNADASSATVNSLTVVKDNIIAKHPTEYSIIKAFVTDAFENPVPGVKPTVNISNGKGVINSISDSDSNGEAIISVSGLAPGEVRVSANMRGQKIKESVVNFTFDEKTLYFKNIQKSKDVAVANGTDNIQVVFSLTDKYGNSPFALDGTACLEGTRTTFRTDNNGKGSVSLKSYKWMKSGEVHLTLKKYSHVSGKTTVDFIGDASTATLKFTLDEQHIPAPNIKDKGIIVAIATDKYGNPVKDFRIDSANTETNLWGAPDSQVTDSNGKATFFYWGGGGYDWKLFYYYPAGQTEEAWAKVKFKEN
ncbi:adhesin [Escherichia coli]|nr:adhesin [Escherichia coli]